MLFCGSKKGNRKTFEGSLLKMSKNDEQKMNDPEMDRKVDEEIQEFINSHEVLGGIR